MAYNIYDNMSSDMLNGTTLPDFDNTSYYSNYTTNITSTSNCNEYGSLYLVSLIIFCIIAVLINMIVLASIYWIRSPMTPILKMSLSLAAADLFASTMFCTPITMDYLRITFNVTVEETTLNIIDPLGLCGVVTTVVHLFALSLNHYIGIMKPLHYNSIVTNRKVAVVIGVLWICPALLILALCLLMKEDNFGFTDTFKFRMSYSMMFIIPVTLMAFFYAHILYIVKKQQRRWKKLSRLGSTKWRGRAVRNNNRTVNKDQKQMEGNIRAIYTTFLIMSTCIVGWTPAVITYTLICRKDCLLSGTTMEELNHKYMCWIMGYRFLENALVIMKMLANPIIYSIRMKEIKDGRTRMYLALTGLFGGSQSHNNGNYRLAHQRSPLHHHQNSASTTHIRVTSCRQHNDNNVSRSEGITNTFL